MELTWLAKLACFASSLLLVSLACSGCGGETNTDHFYNEGGCDDWGCAPCCQCVCPDHPTEGCSEQALSSQCSDACCAKMPNTTGACNEGCMVAGRPYIAQQRSLTASLAPQLKDTRLPQGQPEADAWGFVRGDLGHHPAPGAGVAARVEDGGGLASQLMVEALRSAGLAANPWPEIGGSLGLEPHLPDLLAEAQAHLAASPPEARERWHGDGLAEHASVGSFAKLCVELLVAGAPPRLLRQAIKAQEEELLHAHISLALADSRKADASARTGLSSPLQFPEHSLDFKLDLVSMRRASIDEGLKGEGHSALKLFKQALEALNDQAPTQAAGPSALSKLAWAMANDEARHATLASDIVEWLSHATARQHPEVVVRSGAVEVTEL